MKVTPISSGLTISGMAVEPAMGAKAEFHTILNAYLRRPPICRNRAICRSTLVAQIQSWLDQLPLDLKPPKEEMRQTGVKLRLSADQLRGTVASL